MTTTSTPFRLVADYRMTGDQPVTAIVRLGGVGVNARSRGAEGLAAALVDVASGTPEI